ncbi:MAG TPA: hypothetical protein VFZ52_15785 [Chryseolinea sp.]
MGISGIPHSQVEETFRRLSQKINDIGKKDITPAEFISVGTFLQEILRIEYSGKWRIDQEYGSLNPYYIPSVSFSDFTIPLWKRIDEHWRKGKNVSLDKLYQELKNEISFFK